jgi:hypothetical protein
MTIDRQLESGATRGAAFRLKEKIIEADMRGSNWLALGNEAAETGNHRKAEKLYAKGQFWLDRSNKLRGDGP